LQVTIWCTRLGFPKAALAAVLGESVHFSFQGLDLVDTAWLASFKALYIAVHNNRGLDFGRHKGVGDTDLVA
jgi:hypothetical protein